MTRQEFIDYCIGLSTQTAGREPSVSPLFDAGWVIEILLPQVLRQAVRNAYTSRLALHTVTKPNSVALYNGFAVLPAGVEEEFIESFQVGIPEDFSTFYEDGDDAPSKLGLFTRVDHWAEFISDTDEILPKFHIRDGRIFVRDEDNQPIDDETEIVIFGVTVPQVPTDPAEPIPVGDTILDDALLLAKAMIDAKAASASKK